MCRPNTPVCMSAPDAHLQCKYTHLGGLCKFPFCSGRPEQGNSAYTRWRCRSVAGAGPAFVTQGGLCQSKRAPSPQTASAQVEVEKYLEEQDLPYTVFQPQYIYGPYTNKDCEQWFIDRIIR